MKRIFRSIIDIKRPKDNTSTIEKDLLKRNYRSFLASNVESEDNTQRNLYTWIEAHYRNYDELPDIQLLHQRAESDGDEAMLAFLMDIAEQQPFTESNYRAVLKEKFEEQSKDKLQNTLQTAWQIANAGVKLGKKKVKGISDSITYVTTETRKLQWHSCDMKTSGDIRSKGESKEVIDIYEKKKTDSSVGRGMYSLLNRLDAYFRGIKPGQLMIIAAFTGQAKTIMTANMVYNGIMQGLNGLFIPLEMSYEEMRDLIYVLHTGSPEWSDHPKYRNLMGKITYDGVDYGELSDLEEEFFKVASENFVSQDKYGTLFIDQPTEPLTPSSVEVKAYDYHSRLQDEGKSLDFIAVDYMGLMASDPGERYSSKGDRINSIIQKFKRLALTFDDGRRIRIITPHQINREGFKEASKNDGLYRLSALSDANEAERTADFIISQFMSPEMKKSGILKIGCLKHRKGPEFDPFEVKIDFKSRIIRDFIQKKADDPEEMYKEIPMEAE